MSSSVVLPDGTGSGRPSRRTSSGPSTPTVSMPQPTPPLWRCRQAAVSGSSAHRATVPVMDDDIQLLIRRLIAGDAAARARLQRLARTARAPTVLVAAALVSHDSDELLARAAATATTTRDRQLVAITAAHLAHDEDLLDALVRDHLADHPDSILAAWIATQHQRPA